ncbi:MAG TPA: CocE/NonD family hydrolase [Ktedonobacteraceae bacterium]|nr:CocE/NonD family hydrolase [Ktedonobacteraceae bacterium]
MFNENQSNVIIEKNTMVPMRDGIKLATDIYRPRQEGPVPTLLTRLPYNKDAVEAVDFFFDLHRFLQAGYAVVIQDVRGRSASEGTFTATSDLEPEKALILSPGLPASRGQMEKWECLVPRLREKHNGRRPKRNHQPSRR